MGTQYDVFLSHCGQDCKRDFAVMLKRELERAGIRCFLDERDLQLGDHAASKMLSAMETAHFGIAILSKGFFLREWCVKELQTFVRRKNLVPIFLGIGPGDLQQVLEEGSAVWKGFRNFPLTKEEYGRVVSAAGAFTGERLEVVGGFWDTCIMRVKGRMLRLLAKVEGGVRISEAGLLVGMEGHLVKLKQLLGVPMVAESAAEANLENASSPMDANGAEGSMALEGRRGIKRTLLGEEAVGVAGRSSREIGIVGVKGMGGVGKTTLAKRMYDEPDVRDFFGGRVCWVEVNQGPSQDRICRLQEQILRQLCEVSEVIDNPTIGRAKIRSRLNSAKVLVFLDNVWDEEGSNGVLRPDCLGAGSRIVKTTRDEETIGAGGEQYNLDVLDQDAAWELFCWHAFCGQEPPSQLEHLARRAVECCGGLPLALELVGARARVAEETRPLLDDANQELWWEDELLPGLENHQLGRVTVQRRESVLDNLRLSYDALPRQGLKGAFVLLAGMWPDDESFRRVEGAVCKLAAAVFYNAQNPTQEAKEAVEELKARSLLKVEEIEMVGPVIHVITIHDLVSEVGVALANEGTDNTALEARNFCRWVGEDSLQWPQPGTTLWEHQVVIACKEPGIPYFGTITEVPPTSFQRNIPNILPTPFFQKSTRIKSLVLHRLDNLHMPCLSPGLENCRLLSIQFSQFSMGEDVLVGLTNLHHLDLSNNDAFWEKPPVLRGLKNLRHLDLSSCWALEAPPVLGGLENLEHLDLCGCESLHAPPVLDGLKSLQHLNLSLCPALRAPPPLHGLTSLQHLDLSYCTNLTVPPVLMGLTNLRHLNMSGCDGLRAPPALSGLTSLQHLDLSYCEGLTVPPIQAGLTNLRYLDVRGCGCLDRFDFGGLPNRCLIFRPKNSRNLL